MSSSLWRTKKAKLSLIIAGLLSTHAFAVSGGFANMPLNVKRALADDKLGSKLRINPNVLFLIDDTGSMRHAVGSHGSRIAVTQKAMTKLANKHQDALNYYILDLCETSRQEPVIGKPLNHKDFIRIVNGMTASCGDYSDHSTEGFYDAIYFLRKNMNEADGQYRCQKNFLLYFGDGEANPTKIAWDKDGVAYAKGHYWSSVRRYFDGNSILSSAPKGANRDAWEAIIKYTGRPWDCSYRSLYSRGLRRHLSSADKPCRYVKNADWSKYAKFEPAPAGSTGDSRVFDEQSSSGHYTTYDALSGPADWVGKNDLVTNTSAKNPVDAAGKPWDDPDFPIQTIGTYAVGLGVTDGAYLNGASASMEDHKAILAQTPDTLFNALDTILSDIRVKADIKIPDSYSYTSPASLGGEKIDSAVGVHLLEGTTRSQLRFFRYDHTAKKFETTFTTPTLPPRADRRFNPPSGTPSRPVIANANNQYFYLQNPPSFLNNSHFGLSNSGRNQNEFKEAMIPWITLSADDTVQTNDEKVNTAASNHNYAYPTGITTGERYRVRTTVKGKHENEYYMGDILDSPVLGGGKNIDNLPEFLFASSNDGLSYVFKRQTNDPASTDVTKQAPYSLALRYFPMEMDRDQPNFTMGKAMNDLRRTDYSKLGSDYPHQWMNNGGVTVRSMVARKPKGSTDQYTMVVSTPGQGGRGLFALSLGGVDFFEGTPSGINDSTKPWTQTIPLFETPKGYDKNDLGYIIGNPSVARLSLCRQNGLPGGRQLVFDGAGNVRCDVSSTPVDKGQNADYGVVYTSIYGNGYRHPKNITGDHSDPTATTVNNIKSALHVRILWNKDVGLKSENLNLGSGAQNGTLVAKIEVDNYSGLSMPVSVDMDFDGIVDLAYASTYDGEVYRFDFRGNTPNDWTAQKIFSTQEVAYKFLENDTLGVVVNSGGMPNLKENGTVKQKVMIAPDIFRFEETCDPAAGKPADAKCIRYMVSFGTGSNLFLPDLYDRSLQSTYTIEDRPEEEVTNAKLIKLDDLLKREFVDDAAGKRDVKPRPADPTGGARGWYANFDSKDSFGFPYGERMVASPIMIKDMVLNNTVVYDFTRKNAFSVSTGGKVDLCYKDDKTDITNAGWVMGVSPRNGDSNAPEVDVNDPANKDYKTKKVSLDGLNKGNPDDGSGGAGKKLSGVTNYTLFHRRQSLDFQSSVTDNGGLLSGVDPELKSISKPFRNDCMTKPEAESIRLIGQSAEGLDDSLTVIPKLCPSGGGLLRLNIRDVPL